MKVINEFEPAGKAIKKPFDRACFRKPPLHPALGGPCRPELCLQSDGGAGSVEETQPWPQKMASPPELQETGDSAPADRLAGSGLAPFGDQQAVLASASSQMSVGGKGDDMFVAESAGRVITRIHHDLLSPQLIASHRRALG